MGGAAESRLTQLHEGKLGLAWWRDRAVRRKSTSGASATGLVKEISRRLNETFLWGKLRISLGLVDLSRIQTWAFFRKKVRPGSEMASQNDQSKVK